VASLSQGRTAAAQCGLFTYKSVPVIFEPPCMTAKSLKLCVSHKCHIYQRLRTCALMAAIIVCMRTMRLLGRVHAMIVTSEFRFNNLGIH